MVENDEEILNEFNAFVQNLKQVGVDYSVIVNVEGEPTEHFLGGTGQFHSMAHSTAIQRKPVQRLGG